MRVDNATAQATVFRSRLKDAPLFPNSAWKQSPLVKSE